MIRKDYLVRQFEQFARVMARLFGLRQNGSPENLETEIREAVLRFTDLELNQVENLDTDGLNALVTQLDDERLKMLADLMFERMHFYLLKNEDEKALVTKERCQLLYRALKARQSHLFDMGVYYREQYLGSGPGQT